MQRRDFCKLIAATAAAQVVHASGQNTSKSGYPIGFNSSINLNAPSDPVLHRQRSGPFTH